MTKLKVIELFTRIGAQREALKRAEIEHEVVAISKIDKYALKTYELLHGETPNLGDIFKIEKLPIADMWTYSFPCTDISLAGRLGGFEKESNSLLLFCNECHNKEHGRFEGSSNYGFDAEGKLIVNRKKH